MTPAEAIGLAALFVVAVLIRLPYLWDIPRFTDELQEIIWSMSIARGEILPLTAVDSYYGPLWSYLLAAVFWLFGPSPYIPRMVALLLGAGLVILTYLFVRDAAGRWPAALAAGLLATSGGHVVINSHTARSNSTTPILTTAAIWLLFLALADHRWDSHRDLMVRRRPNPSLLIPAGFLLGLALQTHLSVIALLPGLVAYAVFRGRCLLRTRWPYLAGLAVVGGYANMLIFNLQNGFWSFRHARSLQEGYTDGRSTDLAYYLTNLGSLVQSLSRLLSGTIDVPDSPSRFLYAGLALVGVVLLTRRGGLLLALACLSLVAILPYFNPRYGPILSGRYLIPLLPLLFAAIGSLVVVVALRLAGPGSGSLATPSRVLAALAGLGLVLYPLLPLHAYYAEAVADERTNQPLFRLHQSILAGREPEELVLLDEGLAQEALGAGGTDLKAFRMLLATSSIPHEVIRVAEVDEQVLGGSSSVLFLLEAKKRGSLDRALRATAISPEVASASGSDHRYAVYRLTRR